MNIRKMFPGRRFNVDFAEDCSVGITGTSLIESKLDRRLFYPVKTFTSDCEGCDMIGTNYCNKVLCVAPKGRKYILKETPFFEACRNVCKD